MKTSLYIAAAAATAACIIPLTPLLADQTGKEDKGKSTWLSDRADTTKTGAAKHVQKTELIASEAGFIKRAAAGGKAEVAMAELGVKVARHNDVTALAQMLLRDHTAFNSELEVIATRFGVDVSAGIDPLHQKKIDALRVLPAEQFDNAFLHEMAVGHDEAIALFEEGKKIARADDLSAYITNALPVLKQHRDQITDLINSAGERETPASSNLKGNYDQ